MLSDTVVQWRAQLMPLVKSVDAPELFLTLRLMELEVRHMETTIEYLTGRPHVPLNDELFSFPLSPEEHQKETINAL